LQAGGRNVSHACPAVPHQSENPIGLALQETACLWLQAGLLSALLLGLIAAYRRWISPLLGPPLPPCIPAASAMGIEGEIGAPLPLAWAAGLTLRRLLRITLHPCGCDRSRTEPGGPCSSGPHTPSTAPSPYTLSPRTMALHSPRSPLFQAVKGVCLCAGLADRLAALPLPPQAAGVDIDTEPALKAAL